MTPRQAFALTHPLNYADSPNPDPLADYKGLRRAGNLFLVSILAVDR